METLAPVWACDPCDLSDLGQKPPAVWESLCVFDSSPPAGQMWTEQLSPHLQRNKQLQDTLLQREEELARLQEENNKLREFLNSSFVKKLEEKAKRLSTDGRQKLKRNLIYTDDGPSQTCHHQLPTPQQVSKRVCRNLTAEFCCSEMSSSSEPNLDLWVLRTLGLKDRDTIDTSNDSSSSSPGCSRFLVTSSSESTLNSSFSPSVASSSVRNSCRGLTHQTDCRYSPADCQEASYGNPAKSPPNCTTCPSRCSDFTATGLTRPCEAAFQTPQLTEEPVFSQSPDCSSTAQHPAYWSPSQDKVHFSPPAVPFSPISSSTPVLNQQWTSVSGSQTPRSRTDVAFSMSLSPSSSVKTHSFPQGQAFVRKDPEGRWHLTWVPRQGP